MALADDIGHILAPPHAALDTHPACVLIPGLRFRPQPLDDSQAYFQVGCVPAQKVPGIGLALNSASPAVHSCLTPHITAATLKLGGAI